MIVGEMKVICTPASSFIGALAKVKGMEEDKVTVAECLQALKEATAETIQQIHEQGGQVFSANAPNNSSMWIPCGYFVCERSV